MSLISIIGHLFFTVHFVYEAFVATESNNELSPFDLRIPRTFENILLS